MTFNTSIKQIDGFAFYESYLKKADFVVRTDWSLYEENTKVAAISPSELSDPENAMSLIYDNEQYTLKRS